MSNILYLVHRLPYPPNKGDKVRSYHLLKHLAGTHRVFLGTFIDDPQDEMHVDTVREYCADMCVAKINPRLAKVWSLRGLASNSALTLPYYRSSSLQSWVDRTLRQQQIDAVIVFSSVMAQFVQGVQPVRKLVDFVDVDSAKWTRYSSDHHWPMSWLYRREGDRLLAFERSVALDADRCFFVTDLEADLFRRLAPECADKVETLCNGVDAAFFSPQHEFFSPYRPGEVPLVFTGAMDYWPNIDAVGWFAGEILPHLQERWPSLRFYVVGRSPTPAVLALSGEQVVVTGTVPDVRPYLRYASVVVAPLRLARGVQNKVLEAMAMGLPVVASTECASAVDAVPGRDLLTARTAGEYIREIESLLSDSHRGELIGAAARECVLARYSWEANLSPIDNHLRW